MNQLVSAIMLTTYPRRAEMMAQACLSFLLQSYAPMELIVVNDGEPIVSTHPRVRVVRSPTGLSIGEKRNVGVRAARGELIATWDDDDFSLPERIATQVRELTQSGAKYQRSSKMWLADSSLKVIGVITNASYPTAVMDRATLLAMGGFPDISYLEDMEVFARLVMRGIMRASSPALIYVHRRHEMNVSSRFSAQSLEQHAMAADKSNPVAIEAVNRRMATLLATPYNPVVVPAKR